MSNRITIALKQHIAKEESSAKYDSQIKDNESLFLKVLEERVKSIVESRFKVTEEMINSGFVGTSHYVSYNCEDKKTNYNSGATRFSISTSYPRKSLEDAFRVESEIELDKIRARTIELKDEKNKFHDQVATLLYSYNTKTKLVEDVPEFIFYFKNDLKISKALVPIEQINNLRKQLVAFDITKREDNA